MNILITLPVLLYAGIFDAKKRIIPDKVHVILLIIGLVEIFEAYSMNYSVFIISVSERIAGMFIPAAVLFFIYMINKEASGGGDIKLLSALGFCVGIYYLIEILVFTFVSGFIYSLVTKEKSIPLAVFIFLGAAISCVV